MTQQIVLDLSWQGAIAFIVAAAALLAAVAYLVRVGRKIARLARAIFAIVEQELTHNHGTSMKDDVYGMARTIGILQRDVDHMKADFYSHLSERTPGRHE